jgi:hypothetical protein
MVEEMDGIGLCRISLIGLGAMSERENDYTLGADGVII